MASATIPVKGEAFLGDDPSVLKVLKVTLGDTADDVTINDGDTTQGLGRILCSLPYGIHVYDVGWRVITAFNGGVDILLGVDCGSDCDAFAEDTDIGCTTANALLKTSRGQAIIHALADSRAGGQGITAQANAMGFTPDSDGNNLVAHVWQGDTVNDSGQLEVYVYYHGAPSS